MEQALVIYIVGIVQPTGLLVVVVVVVVIVVVVVVAVVIVIVVVGTETVYHEIVLQGLKL